LPNGKNVAVVKVASWRILRDVRIVELVVGIWTVIGVLMDNSRGSDRNEKGWERMGEHVLQETRKMGRFFVEILMNLSLDPG
jgi:hypothetical protein